MAERDDLDRMAESTAPMGDEAAPSAPRGLPGRYVLLDKLGAGGMGVVFIAYDRELDRKVALKLLQERDAAGGVRLLREAQALAKLKHPNVVTVYDVGRIDDQLFVSMELVEGTSLRDWLAAKKRSWREVARVFLAAGRGLAAAHAAGLVHRDFKPDNVLIGNDGGVRVADFGLARLVGERGADSEPGPASPALEQDVTRSGAVVGTPRYMSPEQREGREADPRADQFSFCVALHEALHGEHPFAHDAEARAPAASPVPRRLRAAVVRGLQRDPAARFPALGPLLQELARDPATRRRRIAVVVGALAVVAAASVWTLYLQRRHQLVCAGAERKLAGVWDGPRRQAVRAAFLATKLPYAGAAAAAAERELDGYAAAFVTSHTRACEATQVRGEQSAAAEDLRMACLDERLARIRALSDVFMAADAVVVKNALQAVGGLPDLGDCDDPATWSAAMRLPADPATRGRLAALNAKLATGVTLLLSGKPKEALRSVAAAKEEARALGHRGLEARATMELAGIEETLGHGAAAEEGYYEAMLGAEAAGLASLSTATAIGLARRLGQTEKRSDEGRRWGRLALAAAERRHDARQMGGAEQALALIDEQDARYDDARRHYVRALELLEKAVGPNSPNVTNCLNGLGNMALWQGRYDEARGWYHRAVETTQRASGPDHPNVAVYLANEAIVLAYLGRYSDALDNHLRAMRIRSAALGPDSPALAIDLSNVGGDYNLLDRHEEALASHRKALAIREAALGPDHSFVAYTRVNIGETLLDWGKPAEARPELERALAILEQTSGKDHPDVAEVLLPLALVASEEGHVDIARKDLQRAITILEKHAGADSPRLVSWLVALADIELKDRRPAAALPIAQRAEGLAVTLGVDHPSHAEAWVLIGRAYRSQGKPEAAVAPLENALQALDRRPPLNHHEKIVDAQGRLTLAEALWALSRERPRATALAQKARDELAGMPHTPELDEADAWLRRVAR